MEKFHEKDKRKSFACEKIYACEKLRSSRIYLCLGKNLNFLKSYLINLKKFFSYKKIIGQNLLKIKLYKKANTSVENSKIYFSKSRTKT